MLPVHNGPCAGVGASMLRKEFNYKQCPKCKRIIERIKGCPHIICICGKSFCFNCEGDWVGTYHACPPEHEEEKKKAREKEKEKEKNKKK